MSAVTHSDPSPTAETSARRSSDMPDDSKSVAPAAGLSEQGYVESDDLIGGESADRSHLIFAFLRRPRRRPSKRLLYFMIGALFMVMFLAGWNDASQGPLLPYLQEFYKVDYLIISIIWISNFIGFLTAGVMNVIISDRLGFGLAAPMGALSQVIGYVFMCWGSPYPLFVIAYLFIGFGLGLQACDAQVNSITTRLPNASTLMFLMHAVYGAGATVSPLVSTPFAEHVEKAYTYFAVSLALGVITFVVVIAAFRCRTEDQVVGKRVSSTSPTETSASSMPEDKENMAMQPTGAGLVGQEAVEVHKQEGSGDKMKRIIKTPATHYMAFFIMIYVGIEVTIGGWATTFLLTERGGNESAGYITTGYFGGITAGRVLLIPVTKMLGQRLSIFVYAGAALALELVVWFVDSLPGNAVAFAFIGFFLGPMYPIVMMVVTEVMPGELQAGTIGWIASLGQAGSAIMPFITGAIANRYGPWVLQPLMVAFIGVDVILWALVVRPKRKSA